MRQIRANRAIAKVTIILFRCFVPSALASAMFDKQPPLVTPEGRVAVCVWVT